MVGSWLRRTPGTVLLVVALVTACAVYAPTLRRGLVGYDDDWLVERNWIVQRPSLATLHAIVLDTTSDTRIVLGAEYLPVRDLSVMADFAIWGRWYPGHHISNLVIYLAAIAAWYAALVHTAQIAHAIAHAIARYFGRGPARNRA
jgi:hypothetical protein